MKKKPLHRISSLLAATVLGLFLLTGCAGKSTEAVQAQEDADTIQVYLWTNSLYEKYAPYVQAQLPDVNIEFIVGNNDLDFYKFLQENGGLPDIITCCPEGQPDGPFHHQRGRRCLQYLPQQL